LFFRPTITDQPRRAGDTKLKTDPVPGVGCNGWLALCDVADWERSNARVRASRRLATRSLNQTASQTGDAIAPALDVRSKAGNNPANACGLLRSASLPDRSSASAIDRTSPTKASFASPAIEPHAVDALRPAALRLCDIASRPLCTKLKMLPRFIASSG